MSEFKNTLSLGRLLLVLLPIVAVALAVRYSLPGYAQAAQQQLETDMLAKLLGGVATTVTNGVKFVDSDGDLLCDPPAEAECVTPEKLVFSYVGTAEESDEAEAWGDFVTALGEATGLPAEFVAYQSTTEQIAALAAGELHVVGLNTGAVPQAVESGGFHPVSTFGRDDGSFGYTMKLLAPAKGGAASPEQLRGKRVAFTTPDSNSGCKAALIFLMDKHNLLPERDYRWGFTFGHEASIKELAAGDHDAAPVASDILERMVAEGAVAEGDFKVLYESERFPPASIGFAHNLAPALREKIVKTLTDFAWEGTGLAEKYGPTGVTKFVPVNYKDDWANIRRINSAVAPKKG